jgi:hypothetical protein
MDWGCLSDIMKSISESELEKAARSTRGACRHFFRIEDILVPAHMLRLQICVVIMIHF